MESQAGLPAPVPSWEELAPSCSQPPGLLGVISKLPFKIGGRGWTGPVSHWRRVVAGLSHPFPFNLLASGMTLVGVLEWAPEFTSSSESLLKVVSQRPGL